MVRKFSKIVLIIILTIMFISFCKIDSYALTRDDRPTLKKGDKFKIINNSYEYKDYGKLWTKNYKEDTNGLYLKKGEIVEWIGEEDTDASVISSTKYFFKVKREKDNKILWMIQENLEKYKVQVADRPSTINAFIKKYNISSSMTDQEFNKIYREYLKKAISENEYNDNLISSDKSHVDEQIDTLGEKSEDIKKSIEEIYKEYCNPKSTYYIMQTESDNRFIAEGYYLSRKYLKAESIINDYNAIDSSAEKFDKAIEKYNSTDSATEKDAALKIINEEWNKLSESEKKERQDKYDNVTQEETKRAEENYYQTQPNDESIYYYPEQNKTSTAGSLDDMIGDADKFIDSADDAAISTSSLQEFSKTFYNIFLTIGIIVATLVGSILGIKFMLGGAEEKAHIKELLVPYIVGCIVIFGAFAIWKIVVTILSNSLA